MNTTIVTNSVSELMSMMDSYPFYEEDERFVFVDEYGKPNKFARNIGNKLYNTGGTSLLHTVMNQLLVLVDSKIKQGEEWRIFDLRQLEFCWDNIGEWCA